jgi:hypothetical protein
MHSGIFVFICIYIKVPLYHCFGMVMGNLASLAHNSSVCYPSEGFDAKVKIQMIIGVFRCDLKI